MDKRKLGSTDLMVSRLGVGLSELGRDLSQDEESRASKLLNAALDSGINFLDTAACYGNSEELVGRTLSNRRDEFVLSTKAGHVAGNYSGEPWTAETVRDSIDRSLRRMQTDYLDIVHLHSCNVIVLKQGEVIQALQDAKQAGKTRYIGYSGDNEAAEWAVGSGLFDTLQTSFNLVDQKARKGLLSEARDKRMGIIIKRPIANAAWGAGESPSSYAHEYYRRYKVMAENGSFSAAPDNPILLALGFVLAHEAVDTAIVGTSNPQHMKENIRMMENRLPIDPQVIEGLHQRFDEVATDWSQQG
jgi:aryl-alcohol dehydrogenase-like predicted oxidoreductase